MPRKVPKPTLENTAQGAMLLTAASATTVAVALALDTPAVAVPVGVTLMAAGSAAYLLLRTAASLTSRSAPATTDTNR